MCENFGKNLSYSKYYCIFAGNKTRHASRQISAPGRVFDFYKGQVLLKTEVKR